ncbi:16S rRNA (uracil(1498)-N(3))-methyltransferase [Aliidiomarina iranensis]|uniref:Ribosomal RNA small subunit methyltransferase E n=1 Tax=Aliidiomarina iranensis TaxID=1434071 RepID=A0A432VV76_9GAMM|nr:16S rRNA (uracil(1498)-N(3))-methyltransferase [Aliidiomarina iranensis]RUO20400.1 16S rRNA (uracil(1498)-N(3))-methyltransferase [Aliidiomarina iranensis]
MRIPRIYHPELLQVNEISSLSEEASNHTGRVLRLQPGALLELFNGDDHQYQAEIIAVTKKRVTVKVLEKVFASSESPLQIHLAQGISKGDRMDFVLQKSVELGVTSITPLFTERCNVKLSGERLAKKQEQWQKIVISACEQSGRNTVPEVKPAMNLQTWLQQKREGLAVTLDPLATEGFGKLPKHGAYHLLIGPEGGFSESEIEQTKYYKCYAVQLGPRILRTETAALAAVTALQSHFGDLA